MSHFNKEKAYDDFCKLVNEILRLNGQIAQTKAYVTEIPNFFEILWRDGYKEGRKAGLKEREINISKKN